MFDAWSRPIQPVLTGARGSHCRVGLLLADIDKLSRVRDRYSRAAAADVIDAVFGVIRQIVGPFGLAAEWVSPEDDEFAVFSDAFPDEAVTHLIAQRIRAGVARLWVPTGPHDRPSTVVKGVTISVGYALSQQGAQAVDVNLLSWAARSALSDAKRRTNTVQRHERLTLNSA